MSKKSGCAFTAAWILVAILLAILVIFWLLSTLFDLHVWDEFWVWLSPKLGFSSLFRFTASGLHVP